jgi:hypothetical protein
MQIAATTSSSSKSADVVKAFFAAFGRGDLAALVDSFHQQTSIVAVRDAERSDHQLYGTYRGREGASEFIANLGKTFDTKAFDVANVIGDGDVAFANGTFTHALKSNGKLYSSGWALMCLIEDGKILEYRFYEDSARFTQASD